MRTFKTLILIVASGVASRAALAEDLGVRLSVGGGAGARGLAGQFGAAFPAEATLTIVPLTSISAGLVASDAGIDHAYGEVGLYLVASLGIGVGYGAYEKAGARESRTTFHLFAGFPIPLVGNLQIDETIATQRFVYILPYYRPSWGPWPGTMHELGVMLKFGFPLRPVEYHRAR